MLVLDYLKELTGKRIRIPPFHSGHLGFVPGTEAAAATPVRGPQTIPAPFAGIDSAASAGAHHPRQRSPATRRLPVTAPSPGRHSAEETRDDPPASQKTA